MKTTVAHWEIDDFDGGFPAQATGPRNGKVVEGPDKDGDLEFTHEVPDYGYSGGRMDVSMYVPITVLVEMLRKAGYKVEEP